MLKNYGFAMPLASEPRPYMAIFAHIWPYMTIFFGHPESTASIRFDHCFWSLRVIVVIDEIFCVLRGLAKTTEKKHVYVVTGIYIYISKGLVYRIPFAISGKSGLVKCLNSFFQICVCSGCIYLLYMFKVCIKRMGMSQH